jgi:hypothetical protein
LNHIIYRHSLHLFLFSEANEIVSYDLNTTHQLLEGMLLLLVNAVTELPLPPFEDQSKRTRITLRREIVHLLISGPCPYSDLQNLMHVCVPESERAKSSILDEVIAAVGDWQEGSSLEPSKVKLKEKAWLEYDPSFPHAIQRTHQKAHENRPKVKSAQPYVPQMPPSHPQFTAFRTRLLANETLWGLLRMLMLSYLSIRHQKFHTLDLLRYLQLACPLSVFTTSLHLLTLVMHSLFSSDSPGVNILNCDDETDSLSESYRRESFARYLVEPIADVQPSLEGQSNQPTFLSILIDIYEDIGNGDDPMKHWIFWILSKITELSTECELLVAERLRQQLDEKKAQELLERRNKARERAMQSMKKSAAAFESHIGNEPEELEEDDAAEDTDGCVLECIVCRSKDSTDTLGFIGHTQASKFLHHDPHPKLHTTSTPENPNVDLHVQVRSLSTFPLAHHLIVLWSLHPPALL